VAVVLERDALRGLDRRRLREQWASLAAQRYEAAVRERERTHPGRLIDAETVAALESLGAATAKSSASVAVSATSAVCSCDSTSSPIATLSRSTITRTR